MNSQCQLLTDDMVTPADQSSQVKSVFKEMHQKSVRRLLGNLTNTVSVSSVFTMLGYDLN